MGEHFFLGGEKKKSFPEKRNQMAWNSLSAPGRAPPAEELAAFYGPALEST